MRPFALGITLIAERMEDAGLVFEIDAGRVSCWSDGEGANVDAKVGSIHVAFVDDGAVMVFVAGSKRLDDAIDVLLAAVTDVYDML